MISLVIKLNGLFQRLGYTIVKIRGSYSHVAQRRHLHAPGIIRSPRSLFQPRIGESRSIGIERGRHGEKAAILVPGQSDIVVGEVRKQRRRPTLSYIARMAVGTLRFTSE